MKEKLQSLIEEKIRSWEQEGIYAISLFVYDDDDNPFYPTVTLGYNTKEEVGKNLRWAFDEREARWNYAFWPQNEELCFGRGETRKDVLGWLGENGFMSLAGANESEEAKKVTEAFVSVLVEIVRDIHASGILKEKFGEELPILIHELEYYDKIAEQNIAANGEELVCEFAEFCRAV